MILWKIADRGYLVVCGTQRLPWSIRVVVGHSWGSFLVLISYILCAISELKSRGFSRGANFYHELLKHKPPNLAKMWGAVEWVAPGHRIALRGAGLGHFYRNCGKPAAATIQSGRYAAG